MSLENVSIFGAGTMGHGIAQVCAAAGMTVKLYDIDQPRVDAGLARIAKNLTKGIARGKVTEEERATTLANVTGVTELAAAAEGADILIEAIPEKLEMKHSLFTALDQYAEPGAIFATNTSSISIAKISECVSDPSRVIGTHFFNPVFIMKLLEIIHHPGTGNDVIDAVQGFGVRIGKECILVRDVPGFATSRLGVALGMEAIRMLEQGVASAADIDKAMVLGYRHPIGPLKLTDLVGLDVRMNIGEYLSGALNNPAFDPPKLMKRLVSEGKLGQKSGEGFYRW
ncbi:MAG: 3-hydroxybutyryl-CoA dehydrogenase [Myxococcota bacterium]|jgi:3-hydroxybutyryl-CoA dehydrogenase